MPRPARKSFAHAPRVLRRRSQKSAGLKAASIGKRAKAFLHGETCDRSVNWIDEAMSRTSSKTAAKQSEAKVPADLRRAFAAAPKAKTKWSDLTPVARRDFISWIDSAKQTETRKRRIERACSMLVAGKRRPCCYSVVSFDLYTALNANAKAKAQWSQLTSIERRDLIGWVDSEKEKEAHKRRIEKACSLLAVGKRRS